LTSTARAGLTGRPGSDVRDRTARGAP
jgi:hypothetical protein